MTDLQAHVEAPGRADLVKQVSEKIVAAAMEKFQRVDVLVNNAGVFQPKSFMDVEEEDLDSFLGINLKSSAILTLTVGKLIFLPIPCPFMISPVSR